MEIVKILNNNVVIALDENSREQVVMGRGLAFKKHVGESISTSLIEKVFSLQNNKIDSRLSELFASIPLDVLTTTDKIISMAQSRLSDKLNNNLYISLTDHCHFAIERCKQGIVIPNVLLWDIKRFYPKEFAISLDALKLIKQRLGICLPEDEAGFITQHLVNAQLNSNMSDVVTITRVMQEIMHIVKYQLRLEYREDSLSYHRFVTHLKFFAHRMLGHSLVTSDDESLHDEVKVSYPQSYLCTEKVEKHIKNNYNYSLSKEEKMFLTIHIERVRKQLPISFNE